MNAILYATGASKSEMAYNAVVAHPGLTSLTILEYAPGLGPQVKAAGVLHELFVEGRIDRRSGKELWEWWPKSGAPLVRTEPDDTVVIPKDKRTVALEAAKPAGAALPEAWRGKGPAPSRQVDRLIALVLAHPGSSPAQLGRMAVPAIQSGSACSVLFGALSQGLVSRARKEGVLCYWPPGQAPADDNSPPKRQAAAPLDGLPAAQQEIKRADIGALAALAKTSAVPAATAPRVTPPQIDGLRKVAGFLIEDKPIAPKPPQGLTGDLIKALDALGLKQSLVITAEHGGTHNAREQLFLRAKRRLPAKKFAGQQERNALRVGRTE